MQRSKPPVAKALTATRGPPKTRARPVRHISRALLNFQNVKVHGDHDRSKHQQPFNNISTIVSMLAARYSTANATNPTLFADLLEVSAYCTIRGLIWDLCSQPFITQTATAMPSIPYLQHLQPCQWISTCFAASENVC